MDQEDQESIPSQDSERMMRSLSNLAAYKLRQQLANRDGQLRAELRTVRSELKRSKAAVRVVARAAAESIAAARSEVVKKKTLKKKKVRAPEQTPPKKQKMKTKSRSSAAAEPAVVRMAIEAIGFTPSKQLVEAERSYAETEDQRRIAASFGYASVAELNAANAKSRAARGIAP